MRNIQLRQIIPILLIICIIIVKITHCMGLFYTTHMYPVIASTLSVLTSNIPVPIGDIFITASIVWIIVYVILGIFKENYSYKKALIRVTEYLAWVYVWFYAAWGLNYSQPNIFMRMRMPMAQVSVNDFKRFADQYADSINSAYDEYKSLHAQTNRNIDNISYGQYREYIKLTIPNLYATLTSKNNNTGINNPFCRQVPAKTMLFSKLSSMTGVTGSMAPFFSEFTLNSDLQPHEYPATFAHEYAHFLGIANEGEANFYSYVVCTSSSDSGIRFSGYYNILRHVLANVRTLLGEIEYKEYLKQINPDIIRLYLHDRKYWTSKRCVMLDSAQSFIYNLYLHGNHVDSGLKSYSEVIAIIIAYKQTMRH